MEKEKTRLRNKLEDMTEIVEILFWLFVAGVAAGLGIAIGGEAFKITFKK